MTLVASKNNVTRFERQPGQYVIEKILEFVRSTGRPQEAPGIDTSKPPDNAPYVDLWPIEIPEVLRSRVGMAPCPICSPDKPKFFDGRLCFFPEEGVLRIIGHECAKSHFGAEADNEARRLGKLAKQLERAEYLLIDNLPKVDAFRHCLHELICVGRHTDQIRQALWHHATKASWQSIVRRGKRGPLQIEEAIETAGIDRFGKDKTNYTSHIVAQFSVAGLSFLGQGFSTEMRVVNTLKAISQIEAKSSYEAMNLAIALREGGEEYLFEAERLLQKVLSELEKLANDLRDAELFLAPINLTRLSQWTEDSRSEAPFRLGFSAQNSNRLTFRRPGKKPTSLVLPEEYRVTLRDSLHALRRLLEG